MALRRPERLELSLSGQARESKGLGRGLDGTTGMVMLMVVLMRGLGGLLILRISRVSGADGGDLALFFSSVLLGWDLGECLI